ncbi:thiosulfate ABC transporter substrate-binding protein CysP [Paenalcaligenes sp. Me131]|uniref:thiosulfate ABC transporter substrate-binding protein CysP n=1 Tax=Paenalcaligenes sp. Me131 TaxID=3392636 RepID=UPI003D27C113
MNVKSTAGVFTLIAAISSSTVMAQTSSLLNASFDVARETFAAVNPKFVEHWQQQTGQSIKIDQSFAGSSRQAQDIIQGKKVDVVTFNQVTDIEALVERGIVAEDWAQRLPHNSSPYYSTITFLVREGNPKNIKDWDDLVRDDVSLVFSNPKTSGNARYSYLGAWLFAHQKFNGDEAKIREFVGQLLANVENFPTGSRGATVAFAQNGQGDVLLTFEFEERNILASPEFQDQGFEIIVPPSSVLAEFPVAVVDKVADERGSRDVATAFLQFLYTPDTQRLLSDFNYRVRDPAIVQETAATFPDVALINPTEVLGPWRAIQAKHFATDAVLDQLQAQ